MKNYPGLTIYIDTISKKISQGIVVLRRVREFTHPQKIAITIYNSLIKSAFDYCDVAFSNLSSTSSTGLQKLQNRAARVITKQSKYEY